MIGATRRRGRPQVHRLTRRRAPAPAPVDSHGFGRICGWAFAAALLSALSGAGPSGPAAVPARGRGFAPRKAG